MPRVTHAAAQQLLRACTASRLTTPRRLVFAVSGGADSLACAWLFRQRPGSHDLAVVVDHNTRQGASSREAAATVQLLRHIGWSACSVAPQQGQMASSGLSQAAARALRLPALAEVARSHGASGIVLAHHARDLAETVVQRIAHASGVDGLAAMAPASRIPLLGDDISVLRPMLSLQPEQLRATCIHARLPIIDDPSNADRRYSRTHARAFLSDACDTSRSRQSAMLDVADGAHRVRDRWSAIVSAWLLRHAHLCHETGLLTLPLAAYVAADVYQRRRLLARAVANVLRRHHAPVRSSALAQADQAMLRHHHHVQPHRHRGDPSDSCISLAACIIILPAAAADCVTIAAAATQSLPPLTLPPGASGVWDRRWLISNDSACDSLHVVRSRVNQPGLHAVPRAARPSIPSFARAAQRAPRYRSRLLGLDELQ